MAKAEPGYKKEEIDNKYNLKVLWSFISPYKKLFYGTIAIALLIEIVAFMDNFIFKHLVDKSNMFSNGFLTGEAFMQIIIVMVGIFVFLKIIDAVAWYFKIEVINHLDSGIMTDVEKKSFWHIINLSYRYHLNRRTGSLISQFTRGVSKIETLVDSFMFNFVPVIFRLALSIGVIFYFDVVTALILLVMCALFIITGFIITNKQHIPQGIMNFKEDMLKQNLSDVFMNIETVKYFAKEKRTYSYFTKLSQSLKESRMLFWHFFSVHSLIQTMTIGLGVAAIFYTSFTGFLHGRISLGSITLIYAAVWKLLPQLFQLIQGYREFIRSNVDVEALFKIFKEKNEIIDLPAAKNIKVKEAKIEYQNVTFAYPKNEKIFQKETESVLKEINLKISPDTKVALVGPSGSGKTTMVKILYRMFDLDEGKIFIDGQDISKVTQNSLRDSMSIVPQEPLLFDNSIYFNIAYANPQASKKEVWKAIRFAQLDKFINNLPYKEDTIIGERGVKLSGGEKQRVSIARALLADKKILILDEATSSLDSETEKEIQKDLEKLMKSRTSIIIAHRLSTIMKADIIVVLQKGRIIEIGNHDELKNRQGGLYKRLWDLQSGGML